MPKLSASVNERDVSEKYRKILPEKLLISSEFKNYPNFGVGEWLPWF